MMVGIRHVLAACPFVGEGYRKGGPRLRREHDARVSGMRVLPLMRADGAERSPPRAREAGPRGIDRAELAQPALGTDATMAWTVDDGSGWSSIWSTLHAEAWAHVAKVSDRFAALQPVHDAVLDRFGPLAPDVACGIEVPPRPGLSQYRSRRLARPGRLAALPP